MNHNTLLKAVIALTIVTLVILIGLVTVFLIPQTFQQPVAEPIKLEPNENGNFILYVGNQSFAISPVDIEIYIDDKQVVADNFDVDNQHTWIKYSFNFEEGGHEIKAISKKGDAVLEKEFEIIDKHWAVIKYGYYPEISGGAGPTPKHLNFSIQNEPIYFE